jgi:hypothetical protein
MWGNLAGKLGATDINATLQKLGNAVAPPAGHDEEDEYYSEDEDYSEDEEEEDEGDGGGGGGGFGFVSLLTRALDDREEEYEEQVYERQSEEEQVQEEEGFADLTQNQNTTRAHANENAHTYTHQTHQTHQSTKYAVEGMPTSVPNNKVTPPESKQGSPQELHVTQTDPGVISVGDKPETKGSVAACVPKTDQLETPMTPDSVDPALEVATSKPRSRETRNYKAKEIDARSPVQVDNTQNIPTRQNATETASKRRPQNTKDPPRDYPRDSSQGVTLPGRETQSTETPPKGAAIGSQSQSPDYKMEKSFDEKMPSKTKLSGPETNKLLNDVSFSQEAGTENSVEYSAPTKPAEKSWEELMERKSESDKTQTNSPDQEDKTSERKIPKVKTQQMSPTIGHPEDSEKTGAEGDTDKMGTALNSIKQGIPAEKEVDFVQQKGALTQQPSDRDKTANTQKNIISLDQGGTPANECREKSIAPRTPNKGAVEVNSESLVFQEQLRSARDEISRLQQQNAIDKEESQTMIERLMLEFQKKESRLLAIESEDRQLEVMSMEEKFQNKFRELEERVATERKEFIKKEERYRQIVEESEGRAEALEAEMRTLSKQIEIQMSQGEQREQRSVRMAEEKVAQAMAILDERDDEINRLKSTIKGLKSSMTEHVEGAEEAEEEVIELQTENENLQEHVGRLKAECAKLKSVVSSLEADAEQFGGLQVRNETPTDSLFYISCLILRLVRWN